METVKQSSLVLAKNADESKKVMNILVEKGGSLKSLADGFELVYISDEELRGIFFCGAKIK